MDSSDWIYKEIKIALDTPGKEILLLADQTFEWPGNMPDEISRIQNQHYDYVNSNNFNNVMERICQESIDIKRLYNILDWRKRLKLSSNICMTSREYHEKVLAPLDVRFGADLVQHVRDGQNYTGKNRIRFIHMSCYAASIIFSPDQNMVDERAYDLGLMFNLFAQLLRDEEFSLEIVITAPDSFAMRDAIDNEKLGNSALEETPEAIFLSAYCNICRLVKEEPVFRRAYKQRRFRYMVTEQVLPYALFQVEYKKEFSENNHIKVDLYSEGLTSNMDRRSMTIFQADDPNNYDFFAHRYEYIRNVHESKSLIRQKHEEWCNQWEILQEELLLDE